MTRVDLNSFVSSSMQVPNSLYTKWIGCKNSASIQCKPNKRHIEDASAQITPQCTSLLASKTLTKLKFSKLPKYQDVLVRFLGVDFEPVRKLWLKWNVMKLWMYGSTILAWYWCVKQKAVNEAVKFLQKKRLVCLEDPEDAPWVVIQPIGRA